MGNIKLPRGHKRNPENHLSWLGEIPALFSLWDTCLEHEAQTAGKRSVRPGEKLVRGCSSQSLLSEPQVSPWSTEGCIHRNTRLWMNTRKVLIYSHLTPFQSESSCRWRRAFIPSPPISAVSPFSLTLNWLVCQMAKHLQLEWIRLIKERLSSKRWDDATFLEVIVQRRAV